MKIFSDIKFGKWLKKAMIVPMIVAAYALSAQPIDKIVDFPGGNMSYKAIFEAIEKQGNTWIGYATQDIDTFRKVEVPEGVYSVKDVLDWIFYNTNYEYAITGNHILISVKKTSLESAADEEAEDFVPAAELNPYNVRRPQIALKSNLLYDMTTTINLGIEIGLSPRWTLDIPVNYNGWDFDEVYLRHWGIQPELRYWFCERFDGWFVGLHGHYAKFNVGGFPDWGIFSENIQNNRYQGHLYGAGVSAGYSFIMKKRWSLEATLGLGYARIVYDKYPCVECGNSIPKEDKNYFGPTKAGLSLVFMIN